ncbi:MAG: PD-(D/E)XK nuclease family protein [Salinivirgaceae bacterium]|nr:PD-(D/E)XK nuclease family protein [Salinivirgaceae bacterium]
MEKGLIIKLLNEIDVILQQEKVKKDESLKRGERFSIFETLGVAHYEVTHSTIIASFLDPKGKHGQGDKFLKLFLSTIGDKTDFNTEKSTVTTEFPFDNGRMDILIEDDQNKAIIIENKIYAGDQSEQLKRYRDYAVNQYKNGFSLYYLTLDGHEASLNSADGVKYECVSYRRDILNWLENSIKESATTPLVRETIIQYRNHIKQLTRQDMETISKDELMKCMADNAEAVAAICNSQEQYKKHVYETFVLPRFEKFSKDKGLTFVGINLFGSGQRGFYFRRQEWKNSGIFIWTDKSDERDFYCGVSSPEGKMNVEKKTKLDCFSKQGSDDYWPYGTKPLDKYMNWDVDTLAEMVNGNYMKYIEDLILEVLRELESKKLPMP